MVVTKYNIIMRYENYKERYTHNTFLSSVVVHRVSKLWRCQRLLRHVWCSVTVHIVSTFVPATMGGLCLRTPCPLLFNVVFKKWELLKPNQWTRLKMLDLKADWVFHQSEQINKCCVPISFSNTEHYHIMENIAV